MISTNKNIITEDIVCTATNIKWDGNGANTIFDKTREFPNG